jgi:xanthine dehydrogenase accessory factor
LKEITDIIKAFHEAQKTGLKTALATVVRVEGSSYRQPGARMLVTETGQLTGAISGGCLEGDALRRALLAIEQQQNKLVTYDTSNEDDIEFGVQLGCNGIVHILFEPIDYLQKNNPLFMLEQLASKRENAVVAVLFSLDSTKKQPGTVCFIGSRINLQTVFL